MGTARLERGSCPECGAGAVVSSAAFGSGRLYSAGEKTNIAGVAYDGSVSAVNPANGRFLWRTGTQWPVIPALAYVNGLVLPAWARTDVLAAATGKLVFGYSTAGLIFDTLGAGDRLRRLGGWRVYPLGVGSSAPPPTPCGERGRGELHRCGRQDLVGGLLL